VGIPLAEILSNISTFAGNAGLGKETILQLAKRNPRKIFLGARSEAKAKAAISSLRQSSRNEVEIDWLPLDLASVQSIQKAAQLFTTQSSRLDILVLNAGVMALPPGETEMGHEIQLGTNFTGHFLLTKLLLPTLLKTAEEPFSDVRVVSLSSVGHTLAPSFETILDQSKLKKVDTNTRYGASKAANILFAAELARRYPSVMSVSVHPGVILTELYTSISQRSTLANLNSKALGMFGTSVAVGAYNQLWAAAGAKRSELVNGAYYVPVGHLKPHNKYAGDQKMGNRLWDWCEGELRGFGALA
jgi:NAD(P)-dependent dehydrogenase (short-subunit alcohol dehydrogenase family)